MKTQMRLVYIWHNPAEHSSVERLISGDEPSWRLTSIYHTEIARLDQLLTLLKSDCDVVMLRLSLPPCVALKLAELVHRNGFETRVILTSRTKADRGAIAQLFSAHIHPDDDIGQLVHAINAAVNRPLVHLSTAAIESAIVTLFNTDDVLGFQFRERFGELYRGAFTFDDYRRFSQACLGMSMSSMPKDAPAVFISYNSRDESLAHELRDALARTNVTSFMAARDLASGDVWAAAVRDALLRCREMLVLVTPHSKAEPWVMIETGAAWALAKRLTPCIAYVELAELPEPLSRSQARSIVTSAERDRVVQEISERINPTKR